MKRLSMLILPLLLALSAYAADLGFATVVDNLDLRKNTKLHVQEYWKGIAGQTVQWSGEAVDVQGGKRSRVKVFIADTSQPLYKGYNIVVISHDIEKAASIKKGQKVKFSGQLSRFNAKRAGAVIEVSDAQLL